MTLKILTALVVLGCSPAADPSVTVTDDQKKAAAGATYGAQLQRCVADNDTPATIDACADGVRARWATKDGGK